MLQIDVITLFPDYFEQPLRESIVGKAIANHKITTNIHHLREFGLGKNRVTDDRPYGGGAGMVMMIEPIHKALQQLGYHKGTPQEQIALTSAKGELYNQETAKNWAQLKRLCLICGHYEGVDERVAQHLVDLEIRIGDYVLTGGEPASLVIIDSLTRLQPDVLGNEESLQGESHEVPGQLGYPTYSRPANYQGWTVPQVLQTGHHEKIARWRKKQSQNNSSNQLADEQ